MATGKELRRYGYRRPFHEFSSRNKRGNKPHPTVMHRREAILNMWWEHRSAEEIAVTLDIAIDTVRDYVRRARRRGDKRAARRTGVKRIMQAEARRKQIVELHLLGYSPSEIAGIVHAHIRLVQMRLKEASEVGGCR